jgi:hypothetical protein
MTRFALKHVVCAFAMAGVCTAAQAAVTSTTTALGAVPFGAPTAFSGTVPAAGLFGDLFTFTLPANGGSGYSVVNFPLSVPGVGTFNTVFSTLTLVSNPDGILFNADDAFQTSAVSAGTGSLSLTWGPTPAGEYYLSVGGIANGTLGGLYSGAISVSPVPEPGTWAMLGVGMGMIGFALRRKMR